MARSLKDMSTACERGLGPGVRSMGLPLGRFEELPRARHPWVKGGQSLHKPIWLWGPGS